MKKTKILHIQETMASGGVERLRLSLAKFLDKDKFDQKFVCTNASGNIPEEIRAEGFEVVPIGILKSPFDWKQHSKVQKIIDVYKPDIIHGAVFEGVTMAALNGWLKKVPVIIIEETSYPMHRSWRGNFLMKIFAKMADAVIGVSPSVTQEYLLDNLKIQKSKVILINNGVVLPPKISKEEITMARRSWGINEGDFIIGSVGRMLSDDNKRFSDLIRAFSIFSKGKQNVKLLLVGEGKERRGYEELANELKIQDKVIFTSYQANVALFYQLMNVFSLVSASESFGLVLAEAMLHQLPVVATKVGGMKDIVNNNETGFLVEPFQIEQIAKNFDYFYQHPDQRIQMGKKGYEKAMNNYTEEVYVKNVENRYLKILREKHIL